jgi:hypothetical protein
MEQNKQKQLKYEIVGEKGKGVENPTEVAEVAESERLKQEKEREEQERTTIKKGLFLQEFSRLRVIEMACKKSDIATATFRKWRTNDPDFAKVFSEIIAQRNSDVEDILMGLVFIKHDGASVRYYLDRKHPEFKPHSVTEVVTGTRTLEDILDEAEKKLKDKKDAGGTTTGPKDADRGTPENTGQAGK